MIPGSLSSPGKLAKILLNISRESFCIKYCHHNVESQFLPFQLANEFQQKRTKFSEEYIGGRPPKGILYVLCA